MKTPSSSRRRGLTLIEVLVTIVVVVLLAVLILPQFGHHPHSHRPNCVNNLMNIGLALRIFSTDNQDLFPWQVSTNLGGTAEFNTDVRATVPNGLGDSAYASQRDGSAWVHYVVISNELSTPKIIVCPEDKARQPAPSFDAILRTNGFQGNAAVGYFLGLNAGTNQPQAILAGDRNLTTNEVAVGPGRLVLSANDRLGFTKEIHNQAGNILLADGSVAQVAGARLTEHWHATQTNSGLATNVWLVP